MQTSAHHDTVGAQNKRAGANDAIVQHGPIDVVPACRTMQIVLSKDSAQRVVPVESSDVEHTPLFSRALAKEVFGDVGCCSNRDYLRRVRRNHVGALQLVDCA